jgi:hypothetical protein
LNSKVFDGGYHRRDALRDLVRDHYMGSGAREAHRHPTADSLSRAGDDRNAIEQRFRARCFIVHATSPFERLTRVNLD